MRVWGRLFCFFICFSALGCEPPPSSNQHSPNVKVNSPTSPSTSPPVANAANVNVETNTNTNANAEAPINYAQPLPEQRPTEVPTPTPNLSSADVYVVPQLIIPVQGIQKKDLRDTFTDARSEGRSHDAIDIMAPQGLPVLAAADGEIAQFHDSVRGGITIYQYSADKKMIYYYAHLQARAANLKVGDFARQGAVIGYVGDTGNAGAGNFHLHFAIWTITDPKRVWEGTNVNPYPLLMKAK